MVRLYEEGKATLATARRISLPSRLNDVSTTLGLVETEVMLNIYFFIFFFAILTCFTIAEQHEVAHRCRGGYFRSQRGFGPPNAGDKLCDARRLPIP